MRKKMKKLSKEEKTLARWIFITLVASIISTTVIDMVVLLALDKFDVALASMLDFKISLFIITFFINFVSMMTSFIVFEMDN